MIWALLAFGALAFVGWAAIVAGARADGPPV